MAQIDLMAMADCQSQDDELIFLYFANNTVTGSASTLFTEGGQECLQGKGVV